MTSAPNTPNTPSSLIGPFKNNLEVCLFLVQRPEIIDLALNMIKVNNQESITIQPTQRKFDKTDTLPEKVNY